jgi:hypothetical protein
MYHVQIYIIFFKNHIFNVSTKFFKYILHNNILKIV